MSSIPPIIKYIEGFIVAGFSVRTQNSNEFNEDTAKLPKLWQQLYSSNLIANANIYGVYSNYESDASGCYTVTAGIASDDATSSLSSVVIHPGTYLAFSGKGPMPDVVIGLWKQIWGYFENKNEYSRNYLSDFEFYNGSEQVTVYIGIK